jgi:xylulokinase
VLSEGRAYTRSIPPARNGSLESFWDAVVLAVRGARLQGNENQTPAAIAISCRGLFGACIDATGDAFWPGWNYGSIKTSDEVRDVYHSDVWAGRDPYAHGYAPRLAGLVLWLHRTNPDEWNRIRRVGALHDYVVYRLTGQWVTDPTTGPEQSSWPAEILEITGLPEDAFPRVMFPQEVVAGLVDAAATDLGLGAGVPVVTGFHDGAAANRGTGAVNTNDGCFTLGTNFVLRAVTGDRLTSGCFCYTVAPGQWSWVNNVPNAATQLDTVADAIAGGHLEIPDAHGRFGALARETAPGSNGVTIDLVPVSGLEELRERVRILLAAGHGDGVVYRAMLESVTYGVRGLIQRARRDGATPRRFVATGGSVRNSAFLTVLSSVIDAPIEVGEPEAGMIGAAMAAAVGAGWYESLDEAMENMRRAGPLVEPDRGAARYYREALNEGVAAS